MNPPPLPTCSGSNLTNYSRHKGCAKTQDSVQQPKEKAMDGGFCDPLRESPDSPCPASAGDRNTPRLEAGVRVRDLPCRCCAMAVLLLS